MLHRLCGPPSIPLSFSLATVLPRRNTYRVSYGTAGVNSRHTKCSSFTAWTTRVSNPVATHTFAPQRQLLSRWPPSPLVFLHISTHFTATRGILPPSPVLQRSSLRCSSQVKPGDCTSHLKTPPTRPLRPIIPNNACPLCITAAAGTELAGASSPGTVKLGAYSTPNLRPRRQGFTIRRPSSPTRRCCVRLSPIAQNSPLLPPVGVWTVSQFQCGRSPSQAGY